MPLNIGVQLAQVPGELVEHQRQGEREVLVLHAGVPGPDRAGAQLHGGLVDQLPVGWVGLDLAAVLLVVS